MSNGRSMTSSPFEEETEIRQGDMGGNLIFGPM